MNLERLASFAVATLILYAWAVGLYGLARAAIHFRQYLTPYVIDGGLYVILAMGATGMAIFKDGDVYKYINPYVVFYLQSVSSVMLAGASALLGFRYKNGQQPLAQQ
jgi:hypothetical protein